VTDREQQMCRGRPGSIRLPVRLLMLVAGLGSAGMLLLVGSGPLDVFAAPVVDAASCAAYYTVQPGDTLWRMSLAYGSSVMAIAQANDIPNPNLIYPGQQFCIPQGDEVPGAGVASATQSTWQPAAVNGAAAQSTNVSVQSMIEQVFGANAAAALNVAACESGLNPQAYDPISIGGSHAAGVFQILYPSTWSQTPEAGYSPYDAWANIQAAYDLSRGGMDWSQWTCQP